MVSAASNQLRRVTRSATTIILLAVWVVTAASPTQAQRGRRPPGVSSSCPQPEAYTLGAGDRLQLDVFNVPEYSREYQVLADGTVNLPVIGSVPVRGLTLAQASNGIRSRFGPYLRRPVITLNLVAPRPLNVAISGEVNRPGSYTIPIVGAGPGIQLPTLTQALTLAGGITQGANLRQVRVIRGGRTIPLNLFALVQNSDLCQNIALRDGDSIIIPTGAGINPQEASLLATTSFSPQQNQPINVVVVGEVTRPGPQIVQPDQTGALPTVGRALQVAGGIRQSADISRIQVRRATKRGGQQTITVNLAQLLRTGDRNQDLVLQQNDTIVVPTAPSVDRSQALDLAFTTFAPAQNQPINIVVVGEVTRPGAYIIQPDQTGAQPTVTRALQVAGGIRQTSDITRVELVRSTRTGGQQTIALNLAQLLAGDRTQDLVLQQGDTIVVPAATAVNAPDSLLLASTNFSPTGAQPLNVNVVGEVQRPGTYVIQPTQPPTVVVGALPSVAGLPTVTQAIQVAGGITQTADIRRIEVRRTTQGGEERAITVNFWQLLAAGDRSQDLVLQQGDTIFIPTAVDVNPAEAAFIASGSFSPATIPVNVVGEVIRPGGVQIPPNTPLNQALLAAGGFTPRARRGKVELLRLNPNGTIARRTIEVDFERGVNEQTNPTLRPNDVVIVARDGVVQVSDFFSNILNPANTGVSLLNFFLRIFNLRY